MADSASVYIDDKSIASQDRLLRRIPPRHFVYDGNLGRQRPSSAAFEDHPDGSPMSVHLSSVLAEHKLDVVSVLAGHQDYAAAGITASLARESGQGIRHRPSPGDPAHAEVFGPKAGSVKRRFAKAAQWVVPPPAATVPM